MPWPRSCGIHDKGLWSNGEGHWSEDWRRAHPKSAKPTRRTEKPFRPDEDWVKTTTEQNGEGLGLSRDNWLKSMVQRESLTSTTSMCDKIQEKTESSTEETTLNHSHDGKVNLPNTTGSQQCRPSWNLNSGDCLNWCQYWRSTMKLVKYVVSQREQLRHENLTSAQSMQHPSRLSKSSKINRTTVENKKMVRWCEKHNVLMRIVEKPFELRKNQWNHQETSRKSKNR